MVEFEELSKTYYNYALNFLKDNCLSQGIEYLKRSIMLNKKNVEALNLIGICEYQNCNFEKSYYFWNESIKYIKKNNIANKYLIDLKNEKFKEFIISYNKGIENLELEKYKEVIKIFKEIIIANNELIEPYVILSIAYYNIKKYDVSKKNLEKAMMFDKFNDKYFKILKEIDSKNINIYKNWIIKKKRIVGVLGTVASISILTGVLNYKEKVKLKDKILTYEKNISKIEEALVNTVKEKNVLNSEIKEYKLDNTNLDLKNSKEITIIKNLEYKDKDEMSIFLEGIDFLKKQEYQKAMNAFMNISEKGEQTTLVGESTFFTAVCAEKINNSFLATEYYEKYTSNFKNCNYYDDALYNYGLMSYRLGDVEKSKKILNKLYKEVPNSIFLNSNVKYILK